MVHILVNWYTDSKPWLTDWANKAANSWLLKIFRLQPVTIATDLSIIFPNKFTSLKYILLYCLLEKIYMVSVLTGPKTVVHHFTLNESTRSQHQYYKWFKTLQQDFLLIQKIQINLFIGSGMADSFTYISKSTSVTHLVKDI